MSPEPRKRTRVACDMCRKKKIRCDGRQRCLNCELANEPVCHYEERPAKKPRGRTGRRAAGRNMDFLCLRLLRLEDVILSLSEKLNGTGDSVKQHLQMDETSSEEDLHTSDESIDLEVVDDKYANPITAVLVKQMELYFGTHLFLLIFSNSGLEWMKEQLGPEHHGLMVPLLNIPLIFHSKSKMFLGEWIDPPPFDAERRQRVMTNPFPTDSTAVLTLIDTYYRPVVLFHNLAETIEMKLMFEKYYSNKSARRMFLTSQLLKMTLVLLTLLMCKTEALHNTDLSTPSSGHSVLDPFVGETLMEWQNELLANSLYYYFRVYMISEGLDTVDALLLLTIFLERNYMAPEIGYMILSVAIRFAQDMGLHRVETYEGLLQEDWFKRKRTWSICCMLDMELCFRSGRTPLINYNDVSQELQLVEFISNFHSNENLKLYHQFFFGIFHIRLKSYNLLFLATAKLNTFEALQESLDLLNAEMFTVGTHIPEPYRPLFHSDPNFRPFVDVTTEEDEIRLLALLNYFMHMMVVNRMPLMFNFPEAPNASLDMYRDLSLNSARTILHLVRGVNRHSLNELFGTWCMFFPLLAFLHLLAACMNQPYLTNAINDLNLLIDFSHNFVSNGPTNNKLGYFAKMEILPLLQFLFKTVLKITITIFEKKTGVAILEGNKTLQQHFDLPSRTFPEFYDSPEDPRATIFKGMSFNAKSPFGSTTCLPVETLPSSTVENSKPAFTPQLRQNCGQHDIYTNHAIMSTGFTDDIARPEPHVYYDTDNIISTSSPMNQIPKFFFDSNIQF